MLQLENVTRVYRGGGPFSQGAEIVALDDVSLSVARGSCFGVVGESGSGKTTLTRIALGLEAPTRGRVTFDGVDVAGLRGAARKRLRRRVQIVFQDPYASLDPRMSVHDIVAEGMVIHRDSLGLDARARTARVVELLGLVGLGAQHLNRYPHEFSGGQRQRICIARALAVEPELLILDEPTSALDVSVQAQVLALFEELKARLDLTYVFISHDLGVVRYVCDRVAVIHRGRIVEENEATRLFAAPQSAHARELIAAMPDPDPDRSPFRRAVL
ncbi:MAG: ABC transporter ATP-binding protein [Methylobacteriaceae bacterium]|nr:ABC transporter ATP-binding protein [Methylobacteriaceae bacterium]